MTIKTDTGTYPETPRVLQLPPAGGKYVDDLSQVEVMRFTDERDGLGTAGGFKTTYSVWNAFNRDNTRLWMFEYGGGYHVGNLNPTTGDRVGSLEEVVPARGSFVDYETAFWSFLDADKIFILVDCQIWSYQPSTKTYSTVADLRSSFPAGARFNQLYVSQDDNRFAAVVRSGSSGSGDYGIMVYEHSSKSIKLNTSFTDINGITMDKSGRFVLLVRNDPEGQVKQRIYNIDTGTHEILNSDVNGAPDYCIGHNDCGDDFIVGGDQWRGSVTARKLSTPHDVKMAWQYSKTGWIDWHVSLRADNDAWMLMSTYGGSLTSAGQQPDGPFVREIFQVGVKEPFLNQFRRLVHTRANWNQPVRNYWATPRATISRDGRFICWTGNNNGPADTARTDVYVARIEPAPTSTQPPVEPPVEPPIEPVEPPVEPPVTPTPPIVKPIPTAMITSPSNGAIVKGVITVTATVTDASEAYLMVDDVISSMKMVAPYEFDLDTTKLSEGNHLLWVRAWNTQGQSGDSDKVVVIVMNAVKPPVVTPPITPEVRKVPWPNGEAKQNAVIAAQWVDRFRFKRHLTGAFAEFEKVP